MAFVIKDRVRESSTTTGLGPFTLAGAVGGYQRFSAVMSIGDTFWYSIVLPGGAWETGIGTYSALDTLSRTALIESSTGSAVSFGAGTKDVFICLPASKANAQNNSFPAGTLMLFQQTAAPTYWTKQVTHNDKALRVTSGTASYGGSMAFSTAMAYRTSDATTLAISQMPNHQHGGTVFATGGGLNNNGGGSGGAFGAFSTFTSILAEGGSGSHAHTYDMRVQYVDLIIASKDA